MPICVKSMPCLGMFCCQKVGKFDLKWSRAPVSVSISISTPKVILLLSSYFDIFFFFFAFFIMFISGCRFQFHSLSLSLHLVRSFGGQIWRYKKFNFVMWEMSFLITTPTTFNASQVKWMVFSTSFHILSSTMCVRFLSILLYYLGIRKCVQFFLCFVFLLRQYDWNCSTYFRFF